MADGTVKNETFDSGDRLAHEVDPPSMWARIGTDQLPPMHVMVLLININQFQNDLCGRYPVAKIGHLSHWGQDYWSINGERAYCVDAFTHWADIPEWPKEFLESEDIR